jgi:hypothetical protein
MALLIVAYEEAALEMRETRDESSGRITIELTWRDVRLRCD